MAAAFPNAMDSDLPFSSPEPDIASEILTRYQNSPDEDHHHLCAAVGAMAQALKDQQIAQIPVAFFGATVSSLDRLSRDPIPGSDPVTPALLSFLSMVVPRVPAAVIRSKWDSVAEMVVRVLGFGSLPVSGIKAGLKCLANLVKAGEKGNWANVSLVYGVVLGFVTDPRPKVRKQAHACLYDVLQSFQGSPAIVSASEGITNVFERFLLLAGGSNSTTSDAEGPRGGAMEVLYILNALKDCLPLLAAKYTTNVLKYCKSLVGLRQPIVTRTIMDILQTFCRSSTSEVASEVLLDVLCSLALYVTEKDNATDEMASTARLLHIGTKKVYGLNRNICIVKLPLIFNTLGDILAGEHEEARRAATEALKGLMSYCIDEDLVKQGVEQIKLNGGIRKSGPTIIEKICCTLEGLLGYRYNDVWDMSFQVISAAFYHLGKYSSSLMGGSIRSLANLQNLPDEEFTFRKQLHECVGSAVAAMGPEIFLNLLPLNLDSEDISDTSVWLLPILKQYIVGAHLKFFAHNILDMVRFLQQKTQKFEVEGRTFSARNAEGMVYQLWSLLPAFCNYPVDTSPSIKDLQNAICIKLPQESNLHGIICSSLQILIRQNKSVLDKNYIILDDDLSDPERKAKEHYTREVAEENLKAIRSVSSELLSVLSDVFLKSTKDNGGCLQSTIRDLASVSDKKLVKNFFKKVMLKLLRMTEKANKGKQLESALQIDEPSNEASLSHARGLLLDLAVSLLTGVDKGEINVLFAAIKPSLQDKDKLVQKKAYKSLATMLKDSDDFLSSNVDELISLMSESTSSCHFSAKRHRLDSLYYLIIYVFKDESEQRKKDSITAFLMEIILALKEANSKTRNRAYDLLVEIGHACGDVEKGGRKENLLIFFKKVAGALTLEKPHMISAAVKGLARLAYEFPDLINEAYSLLPSSFSLMQRKNREIVKANLGLIKVLIAKSNTEGLQMHLRMMVEGLLRWQDDTKNHFKAKVKLLVEMLVRKCGIDAVRSVIPEEHMKLLTNIKKIKERKERKERKANSEEDSESLHTKTSVSRQSKWNHTRIFSDFGDEDMDDDSDEENVRAKTIFSRRTKAFIPVSRASLRSIQKLKSAKSLPEDLLDQMEDDPLDLLDRQRTRAALKSSSHKRKSQLQDEPELDLDGRLILKEDGSYKTKQKIPSGPDSDIRSQTGSKFSAKSSAKGQKRQKTSNSGWAYTGNEYTNKKASGDLKKKDKLDPYAYWPLDRKLLNRRSERKVAARKGMASVMKFAKRFEGKSASGALSARGVSLKKKVRKGGKKRS